MSLCSVLNLPIRWEDVSFGSLEEWRDKIMKTCFCWLIFASTIYNIWKNRNPSTQDNNPYIEEKLIQCIRWEVKIRFATKCGFKKIRGNESYLYSVFSALAFFC
jgi:hypothetical protein